MKRILGKRFLLFVLLIYLGFLPIHSAYAQYQCLPTCDVTDARMIATAGTGNSTLNNADTLLGIVAPGTEATLEIGIFDGDSGSTGGLFWDLPTIPAEIEVSLIADPLGDGTGTTVLGMWSGEGDSGLNNGTPMPDNAWFDIDFLNSPQAMNEDGNFSYILRVRNLSPNTQGFNMFKVRTLDPASFFIFQDTPFGIMSPLGADDIFVTYPNLTPADFTDPACANQTTFIDFCDPTDPTCCLFGTTYDGIYTFYFEVPENVTDIAMWDGDFDFGSSVPNPAVPGTCMVGGPDVDTDDPNTPGAPFLPPWAIGTTAVFQGVSTPTFPPDDSCDSIGLEYGFFRRGPSATYRLVDPNGVVYENVNPSGNIEWEKFSMTTIPPLDPMVDDLLVAEIPAGVWRLELIGTDMQNLQSFRSPFALHSVPPSGPVEPSAVPTLNEWGLIIFSSLVMLIAFYYLQVRKRAFS